MKRAFKLWYTYVAGVVGFIIVASIAIIPRVCVVMGVSDITWPSDYPSYVFLFSCVVYVLIGFVWQDLMRAKERHRTKNWDKPLEPDFLFKTWRIFAPFLVAAALSLCAGIVFSFFKF